MKYDSFGIDIARKFYPLLNDLPIQLPTQDPDIYVFSAYPTLNDARDGGGAVATITSWTQNTSSPYDCSYTIPAIDDPDPESNIPQRTYYIAINFTLQASEQVQTVIQAIILERVSGSPETPGVSYLDLTAVYPAASAYANASQLQDHINTATNKIDLKLNARGIRRSDIQNISALNQAIVYGALRGFTRSQIANGGGDKFVTMYELYSEEYMEIMKDINLSVDTNRDGVADQNAQAKAGYIITSR